MLRSFAHKEELEKKQNFDGYSFEGQPTYPKNNQSNYLNFENKKPIRPQSAFVLSVNKNL